MDSYVEILKYSAANVNWDQMNSQQKEELNGFLWEITVKAAQEDFYTFVKVMAPVLMEGFKIGRHIEVICEELQNLYQAILTNDKSKAKLQVYLPPESSKTMLCSHLFPAWLLGKHPNWRVIAVGHSADHAAKELGANSKRIVTLPEYQDIFPKTKVSRESPGVGFWKTTKGGYYFSGGWKTQFPGKRANLLLTDDMVSEQTKPSELKTINHNYSSGLESRLLTKHSGQLVVNTRWWINDISGFLEDRDGGVTPTGIETGKMSKRPWRIIRVPALLDEEGVRLLDDGSGRFVKDGSYWPEHKTVDDLLDAKRRMTPHQWNALMLQNPIPEEGSIFDHKRFKQWAHVDPPDISSLIISLDTAFSEKETKDSAESVYQVWGVFPQSEISLSGKESVQGNMILLGYEKGHWSFPQLKEKCSDLWKEYGAVLDFFLIENRASGISLIQELREVGLPVVEYNPDRDKISRAHAASAILHNGRIYVNPSKGFTVEFISELQKFPAAGRDSADAFSQAVIWMRDSWNILPSDYTRYEEEDDNVIPFRRRPRSYWGSTQSRR